MSMTTLDRRLPLTRRAVKHAPCVDCARAVFQSAFCIQGWCSETNSIIYLQGGRTCPWFTERSAA